MQNGCNDTNKPIYESNKSKWIRICLSQLKYILHLQLECCHSHLLSLRFDDQKRLGRPDDLQEQRFSIPASSRSHAGNRNPGFAAYIQVATITIIFRRPLCRFCYQGCDMSRTLLFTNFQCGSYNPNTYILYSTSVST